LRSQDLVVSYINGKFSEAYITTKNELRKHIIFKSMTELNILISNLNYIKNYIGKDML